MNIRRFKTVTVLSAMVISAALLTTGVANAAPTTPNKHSWIPETINGSTEYCAAIADNTRNLSACAAGLSEQYRQSAGMTTVPSYLYVTNFGLSQLEFIPSFQICGYHELVTLYCKDSVHLGDKTLQDILQLDINPEMYATFLTVHEATHHTQTTTGKTNLDPIFLSPEVKPFELQSDCVGGMAVDYYVAQGRYTTADAEALATSLLQQGASSTHGSGVDRADAFNVGLRATSIGDCIGGQFASTPLT